MPSFSLLVKDTSPMLKYSSSDWSPGTSETDSEADQYTESSFTKTQASGATMSLTFNGTGVMIVGAKRGNHGLFSVNLDGVESQPVNGSATPDLFNQTLFENNLLEHGSHSLLLTNHDPAFVDVDYVTLQVSIGNDTEDLIINTFQNMHPIFSYTPASSWKTPDFASSFSAGTGHATQDAGAAVEISFQGDGIAVYGPVGPQMTSAYNVQIDNGTRASFSAQKKFYRPQQILFLATNLGAGSHLISMELETGGEAEQLAIDYVNVFTTNSLGGSFLAANSLPSSSPPSSSPFPSSLPVGIIVALALTSAISLAGICMLGYLIVSSNTRRKRRLRKTQHDSEVVQPFSTAPNHPNINPPNVSYSPILQTASPGSILQATSPSTRMTTPSSTYASGSQQKFSARTITHHDSIAPPEYQEGISF